MASLMEEERQNMDDIMALDLDAHRERARRETEEFIEKVSPARSRASASPYGSPSPARDVGADASYNFLTIEPTFTVLDWGLAQPILEEFVVKTRTERGCLYYGWTRCDDKLFCREAYADANAVLAHLENVGPCIDALLKSAAKLDRIAIHGPQGELDKVKPATAALGTQYFAVHSGFANLSEIRGTPGSWRQDMCQIMPHFTLKDTAAALPIMKTFVDRTRTEAGCLYYGWTMCGNKLVCRETYKNGAAVLAHLQNVDSCIKQLLDGPATLDEISIHGPEFELEKVKPATAALGTKYFKWHGAQA